jgi:outer membrane protein assembly factor BamB
MAWAEPRRFCQRLCRTKKILWQKPAPSNQETYGAAVSPLADDDLVIVHAGDAGFLTAFDANSGEVRWRWEGDSPAYASPILVNLEGTRQVVSITDHYVVGLSAADGTLLWQRPWPRLLHISPISYGDTIIVSAGRDGLMALKPTRRGGRWTADVVWETKDVSLFLSNPVVVHDTLFGLSQRASGQFFALDARTGNVVARPAKGSDEHRPRHGWRSVVAAQRRWRADRREEQ